MVELAEFLKVREVAALTRYSPTTVRRLISAGVIPATKLGREYRVARDAVRHLLAPLPAGACPVTTATDSEEQR
jgi:excisionase family DNA binding protein